MGKSNTELQMNILGTNIHSIKYRNLPYEVCINNIKIKYWHPSSKYSTNTTVSLQTPKKILKDNNHLYLQLRKQVK